MALRSKVGRWQFIASIAGLVIACSSRTRTFDDGPDGEGGEAGDNKAGTPHLAGESGAGAAHPSSGGAAGESGSGGAGDVGAGGTDGAFGGDGGAAGTTGGGTARLRVGHLAPDASPTDFCVDPGTGFVGPILHQAGDADGLSYAEVTEYTEFPEGTYTLRAVFPGSSCAGGVLDLPGVELAANGSYTALGVGMVGASGDEPPLHVLAFRDDEVTAGADQIQLRFIHLVPDAPGLDVGQNSGDSFIKIVSDAQFGVPGAYLASPPLEGATFSARTTGASTDALVVSNVDLPEGTVGTGYAIGNIDGAPQPLQLLLCTKSPTSEGCGLLP
jgi:hypothetical protein